MFLRSRGTMSRSYLLIPAPLLLCRSLTAATRSPSHSSRAGLHWHIRQVSPILKATRPNTILALQRVSRTLQRLRWRSRPTLFDYIRRAMPYLAPGSLSNDEVTPLRPTSSPRAILSTRRRSLTRRRCRRCRCLIATASFLTRDQTVQIATAHQREACSKRHLNGRTRTAARWLR